MKIKNLSLILLVMMSFTANSWAASKSRINFNKKIESARAEQKSVSQSFQQLLGDEENNKASSQKLVEFYENELDAADPQSAAQR